jgi:hypothetical protein
MGDEAILDLDAEVAGVTERSAAARRGSVSSASGGERQRPRSSAEMAVVCLSKLRAARAREAGQLQSGGRRRSWVLLGRGDTPRPGSAADEGLVGKENGVTADGDCAAGCEDVGVVGDGALPRRPASALARVNSRVASSRLRRLSSRLLATVDTNARLHASSGGGDGSGEGVRPWPSPGVAWSNPVTSAGDVAETPACHGGVGSPDAACIRGGGGGGDDGSANGDGVGSDSAAAAAAATGTGAAVPRGGLPASEALVSGVHAGSDPAAMSGAAPGCVASASPLLKALPGAPITPLVLQDAAGLGEERPMGTLASLPSHLLLTVLASG